MAFPHELLSPDKEELNSNFFTRMLQYESRHSQMFYKIRAFKNFAKYTGKHLHRSLYFNKISNFINLRLQYRCFAVNFAKNFYRTPPATASAFQPPESCYREVSRFIIPFSERNCVSPEGFS